MNQQIQCQQTNLLNDGDVDSTLTPLSGVQKHAFDEIILTQTSQTETNCSALSNQVAFSVEDSCLTQHSTDSRVEDEAGDQNEQFITRNLQTKTQFEETKDKPDSICQFLTFELTAEIVRELTKLHEAGVTLQFDRDRPPINSTQVWELIHKQKPKPNARPRFDIARIDAYVSKGGNTGNSKKKNQADCKLFKNTDEYKQIVEDDQTFAKLWNSFEDASYTAVCDEQSMPEENEDDNVEYKLTLADLSLKQLIGKEAQMQRRLRQGQGHAFYEIGVHDFGTVMGISKNQIKVTMAGLYFLANRLDPVVTLSFEKARLGTIEGNFSARVRIDQEFVGSPLLDDYSLWLFKQNSSTQSNQSVGQFKSRNLLGQKQTELQRESEDVSLEEKHSQVEIRVENLLHSEPNQSFAGSSTHSTQKLQEQEKEGCQRILEESKSIMFNNLIEKLSEEEVDSLSDENYQIANVERAWSKNEGFYISQKREVHKFKFKSVSMVMETLSSL